MRCFALVLGLFALTLDNGSLAFAQTSQRPHLDLVRGLRKESMPDLALKYLDQLSGEKPDPGIEIMLPLEYARTWLDLAAIENEEGKRSALISQAKRKLEVFIAANPKHQLAPQANVELARLLSVQGKTLIRKARRLEDKNEQKTAMDNARPILKSASDKYLATVGLIDAQIKQLDSDTSPVGKKLLRELKEFRLTSQLDQGINLFSMGDTYIGDETKDVDERGKAYSSAKKIFERIMYEDDKLPICWIARAWSAQSDMKAGDEGAGNKTMNELLLKKNVPAAAAGIRVGRYFTILNNFENSAKDPAKNFLDLEKNTTEWLRDYVPYRDTAEGQGARYYLALSKRFLGASAILRDKNNKITGITVAGKARFEEAQRLLKDLSEGDNEFSERATRTRSQILVTIADADGHGDAPPLESLGTFERCYLMAQVQAARFNQFKTGGGKSPPPEADVKKEEHRRFLSAIGYLEHGLTLANASKDSVREIFSAKLFLVGCYFQLKMYPQAAVLSEFIARENPGMSKASTAGMVAVQAYNQSQIDLRRQKAKVQMPEDPDEQKKFEAIWDAKFKADVEHIRRAATFMVKQWKDEAAADESRHILGFLAIREKKWEEAWTHYSEIQTGYVALQAARLELAGVMFTIVYPTDEVKDAKRFNQIAKDHIKLHEKQWTKTIALLEAVPMPAENCSLSDAIAFLDSRAQLARMYALEGSQAKAHKTAEAMLPAIGKFDVLTDDNIAKLKEMYPNLPVQKASLVFTAQNLLLNSIRALAYEQYEMGDHAGVAEKLNPLIEEIKKDFDKDTKADDNQAFQTLRKSQKHTVVLALQSSVQDGKIDRASELIDILEKSGGSADESQNMLQSLVNSVRGKIVELEADKNDKGKIAEAKVLKEGFAKLLEKIAGREKLPIKMRLFLAQGLGSVDAFAKAAEQLEIVRKTPTPPKPAPLPENATDAQQNEFKLQFEAFENANKFAQQSQFLLAKNYRQAKDYPNAIKIFDEIIIVGKPVPGQAILPKEKRGWGYASLNVRREKAMTLEAIAKAAPKDASSARLWGAAVQEWVALSKIFAPELVAVPKQLAPADEMKLTDQERAKRAKDSETNANKRAVYFELYFEQKRCSAMAYHSLGADLATKGDKVTYEEKFATLAKGFHDLQTKNKTDLSSTIKDTSRNSSRKFRCSRRPTRNCRRSSKVALAKITSSVT